MTRAAMGDLTGEDFSRLLEASQRLSTATDLEGVITVVKQTARALAAADGVTFVLRDEDRCYYVDEDAIAPLWKGGRFPINSCASGWAMIHREPLAIEDIYVDSRIPHDVYRKTFVKSMLMVPIRRDAPLGAIGSYWAERHRPTPRDMQAIGLLADATAIAMANVALTRRLQDSTRLRDEFIVVAAHELRTPLTPLRMHLDRLELGLLRADVPQELRKVVSSIVTSVDRVERLVEDLLGHTRMWTDRLVLSRSPVDAGELVRVVVDEQQSAAVRQGVQLSFTPPATPVTASWDPTRVKQAVEQLVGNALKFGAGRPVEVVVGAPHGQRGCRVAVRDHGIGISPDDQQRIRGRFERAVGTNEFGGFGLGLWIVEQVAAAHGGRLDIESAPGAGSTFTLELPTGL